MAEKARVAIEVELDLEAKRVESLLLPGDGLLLDRALKVSDLLSSSKPSVSRDLSILLRVDEWLHALVVRRVRFVEIDDVEGVVNVFARVLDLKVEPLSHQGREGVEVSSKF